MWLNTAILAVSVSVSQDDIAESFMLYNRVLPHFSSTHAKVSTTHNNSITIYLQLKQSGCSYPEKYVHFNTFPLFTVSFARLLVRSFISFSFK